MSRASREADIAAAEAYFEKIRNTPDPDWAQEGGPAEPQLEQTATTSEIPIVGVAVMQRGNPSWGSSKLDEARAAEEARLRQEYLETQRAITKEYEADPLDLSRPLPHALLQFPEQGPAPDTDPIIEAFYDSPNAVTPTHRHALRFISEGQREKFGDNLSALLSTDMRDTVSTLPDIGAMPSGLNTYEITDPAPLQPVQEAAAAIPEHDSAINTVDTTASLPQVGAMPKMPQAPDATMSLRVVPLHQSMGRGLQATRSSVPAAPSTVTSPNTLVDPSAGAALVDRINSIATVKQPMPEERVVEFKASAEAEEIVEELRQQQKRPENALLEQVLAGLRRSVAQDRAAEQASRQEASTPVISERLLIDNPRAVGEAVFSALGLTIKLEADENGNQTQRVVRDAAGSVLLSTDLRGEQQESRILRTKQGVRRFLGRVASALGGNIRVSRV